MRQGFAFGKKAKKYHSNSQVFHLMWADLQLANCYYTHDHGLCPFFSSCSRNSFGLQPLSRQYVPDRYPRLPPSNLPAEPPLLPGLPESFALQHGFTGSCGEDKAAGEGDWRRPRYSETFFERISWWMNIFVHISKYIYICIYIHISNFLKWQCVRFAPASVAFIYLPSNSKRPITAN